MVCSGAHTPPPSVDHGTGEAETVPSSEGIEAKEEDREQSIRFVLRLAREGEFGRAIQKLNPRKQPLAVVNAQVIQQVQDLHPAPVTPLAERVAEAITVLPLLEKQVWDAVVDSRRLTAAGASMWSRELVEPVQSNPYGKRYLAWVVDQMARRRVPEGCANYLYGSRVVPLTKSDTKIRPIVVGEFLVKVAAKATLASVSQEVQAKFVAENQFGVAASAPRHGNGDSHGPAADGGGQPSGADSDGEGRPGNLTVGFPECV